MLTMPESDEFDHPSSTLYFRVDDIVAGACGARPERGVPFEDEPQLMARMPDRELWMTFFRDPDRNLHGLMSEVRDRTARRGPPRARGRDRAAP